MVRKIIAAIPAAVIMSLAAAPPAHAKDITDFDYRLLFDENEWNLFNDAFKYNYILGYLDDMNDKLGLQGTERVQRSQVNILGPDNPNYATQLEAYTNRLNEIYLKIDSLTVPEYGACYGVHVLAHEMKHVEQNLHGRIDWDMANAVDYQSENLDYDSYEAIPHEKEAEEWGVAYLQTEFNRVREE